MVAMTPLLAAETELGPLQSRYVDAEALPWKATSSPGIDVKVLFSDEERGLMTALFRWAPGAKLELHEHVDVEQSYILEGRLVDEEGASRKLRVARGMISMRTLGAASTRAVSAARSSDGSSPGITTLIGQPRSAKAGRSSGL